MDFEEKIEGLWTGYVNTVVWGFVYDVQKKKKNN